MPYPQNEVSNLGQLRKLLKDVEHLPDSTMIMTQVVPQEPPGAWNMQCSFNNLPESKLIQLRVEHPELKTLPKL